MPGTRIKRGLGLILLGAVVCLLGQVPLAASDSDGALLAGLAIAWSGVAVAIGGAGLLLWGLLS